MAVSSRDATAVVPGKRKGMGALPFFCLWAVALAGMATPATGAVYKVGDSAGWTIIGNVNYTAWAASKAFHIGDTIVFEYNKQFHNVLEVNRADYRNCNPQSPLDTQATGNDSFTLKRGGHRFFLCGVPGHCTLGQKVDIRVPKRSRAASGPTKAASPSSSPSPPLSPATPTSPPATGGSTRVTGGAPPSQQKNGAARCTVGWALALWAAAMAAATVGFS